MSSSLRQPSLPPLKQAPQSIPILLSPYHILIGVSFVINSVGVCPKITVCSNPVSESKNPSLVQRQKSESEDSNAFLLSPACTNRIPPRSIIVGSSLI